jgi:hypothetical protein
MDNQLSGKDYPSDSWLVIRKDLKRTYNDSAKIILGIANAEVKIIQWMANGPERIIQSITKASQKVLQGIAAVSSKIIHLMVLLRLRLSNGQPTCSAMIIQATAIASQESQKDSQ